MVLKTLRFAGRMVTLASLVLAILTFSYRLALAPQGDKRALGGRTIASVQEEEFNRKLERFDFCFGARFHNGDVSMDRRRVCKAIVVQKLNGLLNKPGVFLSRPIRLQCQDSPRGPKEWKDWDGTPVIAVRPNRELEVVEHISANYLVHREISSLQQQRADAACEHVLYCQKAVQWSAIAPMDTLRCALDKDPQRRRIILDLIANQMFHVATERTAVMEEFLTRPQEAGIPR